MNNIEAINYRRTPVAGMPFTRWQEARLTFLYAVLHSLMRMGIRV